LICHRGYQPTTFKRPRRFAYGTAADTKLIRQVDFVKSLSGLQLPRKDHPLKLIAHVVRERAIPQSLDRFSNIKGHIHMLKKT
jgi:hypothetical protein